MQTKYIQVVQQFLIIDFSGNVRKGPGKHSSWLLDQSFINSIINMEGVEGVMEDVFSSNEKVDLCCLQ